MLCHQGSRFQGWFDANDRDICVDASQSLDRSTGSCVAGDHQGLDPLSVETLCVPQRQSADLFYGLRAIWSIGGISEIQIVFTGHQSERFAQHADPAHTGIKKSNWQVSFIHG